MLTTVESGCSEGQMSTEVEMKSGSDDGPVTNMPSLSSRIWGTSIADLGGRLWANAIALEIEKVSTQRPMTHDLIKTVLTGLSAGVPVVVTELKGCFPPSSGWKKTDS